MSRADAPAETTQQAVLHRGTDTRLSGGWVVLTRVVWVALVACFWSNTIRPLYSQPVHTCHFLVASSRYEICPLPLRHLQ